MQQTLHVVMVEDSVAEAEIVARWLKKAGMQCEIRRVETEPDLRRALAEHTPDIILSDFSMPQFTGMGALKVAQEVAPDIPFVFVSGTIGEERAIDALRRGATDYVLKTNLMRLVPAIERALRETETRLKQRATEQLLHDIVATSQDWIWQLDAAGRFTFASPAVQTILGYEPDELLEHRYDQLRVDGTDDPPALPDPVHGPIKLSGSVARWRHRDGQVRWLERNATVIYGARGELLGYRGTDRDVTLRREQELRIQRLSRVTRMLSTINSAIVRISDRSELLAEVCRIAHQHGGYPLALINLVVPGSLTMIPAASAGMRPETLTDLQFPLEDTAGTQTMTSQAIQSGNAMICNDVHTDPAAKQLLQRLHAGGIGSLIVLPLLVDGTGIGVCVLCSHEADFFDDAEVSALREMVANIGFALQYYEKETTVKFLSYFDGATGLAKRSLFCERLARKFQNESEPQSTTSIIVFDVQRLGLINDTYGRHVSDLLLERIADRMKRQLSDSESAAHFGGGTFAAAFHVDQVAEGTGRWMQGEVANFFVEPFLIEGHEIRPSIRCGVACFPMDGQSADTVVQNAEAALNHAKESDEHYAVYGLLDRALGSDRIAFESRLAGALDRREFVLHYQPKVNLASGRIEGLEALIRWQDPAAGLVGPVRFIPLLESTGLIADVGQWVLEQAALDCQLWVRSGLPPMRVAVNVSPVQLKRRDFVARTIAATRPWATEAAGLDIEITESSLMQDVEASTRKLEQLRQIGMRVAIDDFGTGYSSLRRLAHLPIDTLKIDQSFIRAITDTPQAMAIVETIVALARSCGMSTVAEGVETLEQLQRLRTVRCDQVQGYLFSKPVAADQIPQLIARLRAQHPPVAHSTTMLVETLMGLEPKSGL
ncbi:MAG TPA: EAL domain-containing protein [Steroidobacteraceae bacterium]|jgi:diguanylate cyclase (GGDEF)-like protein/PAS domain S-box-containing protein